MHKITTFPITIEKEEKIDYISLAHLMTILFYLRGDGYGSDWLSISVIKPL
jgi:hypothetical protein